MGCGSSALKHVALLQERLDFESEARKTAEKLLIETRNETQQETKKIAGLLEELAKIKEDRFSANLQQQQTPRRADSGLPFGQAPASKQEVAKMALLLERLQTTTEDLEYKLNLKSKDESALEVISTLQRHIRILEEKIVALHPEADVPQLPDLPDFSRAVAENSTNSAVVLFDLRQRMRLLETQMQSYSRRPEPVMNYSSQIESSLLRPAVNATPSFQREGVSVPMISIANVGSAFENAQIAPTPTPLALINAFDNASIPETPAVLAPREDHFENAPVVEARAEEIGMGGGLNAMLGDVFGSEKVAASAEAAMDMESVFAAKSLEEEQRLSAIKIQAIARGARDRKRVARIKNSSGETHGEDLSVTPPSTVETEIGTVEGVDASRHGESDGNDTTEKASFDRDEPLSRSRPPSVLDTSENDSGLAETPKTKVNTTGGKDDGAPKNFDGEAATGKLSAGISLLMEEEVPED